MNVRHTVCEALIVVAALAVPATICRAQTATLLGLVLRDSSGQELSGAEVRLAGLPQFALTNSRGGSRIDALPPGRYALGIRHVGFRLLTDTIDVVAGQRLEREFVMTEQPQELDSVHVSAPENKFISPNLRGFEERRTAGRGGYFITDSSCGGMTSATLPEWSQPTHPASSSSARKATPTWPAREREGRAG